MSGEPCPVSGKVTFDTEQDAKDELARIIVRAMRGDRRRFEHRERGVYKCGSCRGWHLTSRPWSNKIVNKTP
jgi:hypothetical protein